MKKILFILIMVFTANTCFAARGGGFMGWYKKVLKTLNSKIEKRLAPKVRISAVAAVRGADQSIDPMELYWKGGMTEKAAKKLEAEKKEFIAAIEKVIEGKTEEGKKLLKAFIKKNADSLYVQDAKEALSKLPTKEKIEKKSGTKEEVKKAEKSKSE
ncbi:MAG: hypothetical protein U9Q34_04530 [Elusimicrobiota bacterium]|nr:hypothetical protein [Elusimicrobiota bacterium]